MPGWHEAVKDLVAENQLVLLGVTQEQHPERCRLFAQWKQLDWPILHDPINSMAPIAVPIVIAIDEHGIVRSTRPSVEWVRDEFLKTPYPAPQRVPTLPAVAADVDALRRQARQQSTAENWRAVGDAACIWGGRSAADTAIDAYQRSLQQQPTDAQTLFRLGVAFRMRFETERRQPGDFQQAVDHWDQALQQQPNQYIWRRRIQQYGPRLIKPYPFYDWVSQAREEVSDRGEQPVTLPVEPSGAELAAPARSFPTETQTNTSPDPDAQITRDSQFWIQMSTAVVPGRIQPGESVRVHLEMSPTGDAHWNNEAEPVIVWWNIPESWRAEQNSIELAQSADEPESKEPRRCELELQSPAAARGSQTITGYALYNVCENQNGQCLYRRQDFSITVHFAK